MSLVRTAALLFSGACAGLGGAFPSLVYTPIWTESMTAGRGWIAVALVVFAPWRPGGMLLGALLFGGITVAQFHLQGAGLGISPHILSMLPYTTTIMVLVLMSRAGAARNGEAPASLGTVFDPVG